MTPEEKAATKRAMQNMRQADLTAIDEDVIKTEGVQYDAKQGAADAKASKAMPPPTKAERQKDLQQQTKGSTGQ